jgi:hypothetical protein
MVDTGQQICGSIGYRPARHAVRERRDGNSNDNA